MKRLLISVVGIALLAAIPALSLADATHVVRKGDTLGKIARAHHVSVAKIQEANGLEGARLAVGTKLVLPGGKAHPKRGKASSGKRGKGTVRKSAPAEAAPAGAQLSLVEPQGGRLPTEAWTLPTEAWTLPTEAELTEIAQAGKEAGTAAPGVAGSPDAPPSGKADASIKDRLLRVAQRMLAVPYRFGGTTLWGLDCSGFVQKTFAFLNLDLPRSAREQFRKGTMVAKADLSPGDLVFFRTYATYPSHVGIYLGDNRFVHASSREKKVTVDSLDTPYYVKRYIGAKRLLFEENDVQN
ncbi:MAG: endopeptidase LytE [Deltaproteobacteria bacterium]|nr:endopeptidase LytE [Deltaproteobacteria bacterium]MBP2684923.1 endopeptidase LytE [Deltaproteobacteria bacterium]